MIDDPVVQYIEAQGRFKDARNASLRADADMSRAQREMDELLPRLGVSVNVPRRIISYNDQMYEVRWDELTKKPVIEVLTVEKKEGPRWLRVLETPPIDHTVDAEDLKS